MVASRAVKPAKGGGSMRFRLTAVVLALAVVGSASAVSVQAAANPLQTIDRFVIIYEENHSFDNLYGGWEGVNGTANANAAHTQQVDQAGALFSCLKQDDVNLTS